jgi:predicted nucleic acid-binding protein
VFLLDTNVVSEFRRPRPHGGVVAWAEGVPDEQLHLSAVTFEELQAGIEIPRERDPEKAAEIGAWVDRIAELYRILAGRRPGLSDLGAAHASSAGRSGP